jgi:hypothetical protein
MISTYTEGYNPKPYKGPARQLPLDARHAIARKRVLALRKKKNEEDEDKSGKHAALLRDDHIVNGERRASFLGEAPK